jgi:DNA primase
MQNLGRYHEMRWNVGFCTGKGIMAGRVAIPIHNEQGELVAYAGRWTGDPPDGEGKYKLPTGFHKSVPPHSTVVSG